MAKGGVKFEVDGSVLENPRDIDVVSAVERIARMGGGPIMATRANGFYVEAEPSGDGRLTLACGDERKHVRQFATAPVSTTDAVVLFNDFLAGGDAFRRQCQWRGEAKPAPPPTAPRLGILEWFAAGATVVATLVVVLHPWLLPAALALAFAIFVTWKSWQEIRIRRWPKVYGSMTASGLKARRQRFKQEATRLDNIPDLRYEFSVDGKRFTGTRYGLNTEYAGVDVGALVQRYPVGAIVQVSYNPKNPSECLLDPDENKGLGGEVLYLLAILGLIGAAFYYGASTLNHWVAQHFPRANPSRVVFATSGGLLFLLMLAWSFRPRSAPPASARTQGVIAKAEIEEIAMETTGSGMRGGTYLRATVEASYTVNGLNYVLRTGVGPGYGPNRRDVVQEQLTPYPVGKAVTIDYAPTNPASAWIEGAPSATALRVSRTVYRLLLLAAAAICCTLAGFALHVR